MKQLEFVTGNNAYLAWSPHPWLTLRKSGAPFDDVVAPLSVPVARFVTYGIQQAGK